VPCLAYIDYNLYTAAPVYDFGRYKRPRSALSLEEIRERGYEKNSYVVKDAAGVFEVEAKGVLKDKWRTAGKDGQTLGPRNLPELLDLRRFGPAAVGK